MIAWFLKGYYSFLLAWRSEVRKLPRNLWFVGIPEWYTKLLASEDYSTEMEEVKMVARQSREEVRNLR